MTMADAGDGWKLLGPEDMLREGDELWVDDAAAWRPVVLEDYGLVSRWLKDDAEAVFRRRITQRGALRLLSDADLAALEAAAECATSERVDVQTGVLLALVAEVRQLRRKRALQEEAAHDAT